MANHYNNSNQIIDGGLEEMIDRKSFYKNECYNLKKQIDILTDQLHNDAINDNVNVSEAETYEETNNDNHDSTNVDSNNLEDINTSL